MIGCNEGRVLLQEVGYCSIGIIKSNTPPIISGNNMGQKCEGDCGLWVRNEMIKRIYPENLKIVKKGAV